MNKPTNVTEKWNLLVAAVYLIALVLLFTVWAHCAEIQPTREPACPEAKQTVTLLNELSEKYPADWHIIVACNEGDWQDIQRHFGDTDTNYGFTVPKLKMTFVRGFVFDQIHSKYSPRFLLMHELGHIRNGASESAANEFAAKHQ